MGKGGAVAPWKCCKVFCALTVILKRSVDLLFMYYFQNFSDGRSGSFSSFSSLGLCFEGEY